MDTYFSYEDTILKYYLEKNTSLKKLLMGQSRLITRGDWPTVQVQ